MQSPLTSNNHSFWKKLCNSSNTCISWFQNRKQKFYLFSVSVYSGGWFFLMMKVNDLKQKFCFARKKNVRSEPTKQKVRKKSWWKTVSNFFCLFSHSFLREKKNRSYAYCLFLSPPPNIIKTLQIFLNDRQIRECSVGARNGPTDLGLGECAPFLDQKIELLLASLQACRTEMKRNFNFEGFSEFQFWGNEREKKIVEFGFSIFCYEKDAFLWKLEQNSICQNKEEECRQRVTQTERNETFNLNP